MVVTFQSQVSLAVKYTLLYHLCYHIWDHNLQKRTLCYIEKDLKPETETINSLELLQLLSTVIIWEC